MGVTMPENDRPQACPDCAEPAEDDDLFCGACGTDLHRLRAASESGDASSAPADAAAGSGDFDPRPPKPAAGTGSGPQGAGGSVNIPEMPPFPPGTAAPGATAPAPEGPDTDGPEAGGRQAETTAPAGTRDDSPERGRGRTCVACGTGPVGTDGHCTHCGHKQPVARDHWEHEVAGIAAGSDRGLRHRRNEDYFVVASATTPAGRPSQIAVVCDGVSSAARSDQASEAAAEAAAASLRSAVPRGTHPQHAMQDALVSAAGAVDALATPEEREAQRNSPACTIVGAVTADGILTVGWVGDSRAYWVPDDRTQPPSRLTRDDSWAAQMVGAGLMSEAEAQADPRAHAITGWLGADAYELDPHTASFKPDRSGVVVVCSDGLWNYAQKSQEIADALPVDAAVRPLAAVRHLVGFALDGGGHDNVTVALVPVAVPEATPPG
ncbi:hypothetical protein N566_17705 [Streptomycetaceae bacterium MP113-05]|nr:hypothetical protein N566_17705 [Streptomycetaceae bacterium MP113-05]